MSSVSEAVGKKKAVLFDLFHTLTVPETGQAVSTSEFLGVDREKWNQVLWNHNMEGLKGIQKDGFTIMRTLVNMLDPGIPDEKIEQAVVLRRGVYRTVLQNIPEENIETLKLLKAKGIKIGLVSNADVIDIGSWSDSPLSGIFDIEVFSCLVGFVKPEPAIYLHALEKLGVAASEAMFVGDGGSEELKGAKEVGLSTVLMSGVAEVVWKEKVPLRREWADYEIRSLSELTA